MAKVHETKRTCQACGKIWFTDRFAELEALGTKLQNTGAAMENNGKTMMACGGCFPAAFVPDRQKQSSQDPNQCPACGSKACIKENIVHNV